MRSCGFASKLQNLICIGVVPGPNEPKYIGTFMEPLIDELEDLAQGVPVKTLCLSVQWLFLM
jgi:anthranilate/para-aminobenzoate synthase component II